MDKFIRRCIFCYRNEDEIGGSNQWSEEHIIPLAFGNRKLTTYDVCNDCNNKLGHSADAYAINSMLTKLIRQIWMIPNRKGKIPNALQEGTDELGRRIRTDLKLNHTVVPTKIITPSGEPVIWVNSEEELRDIAAKEAKRKKVKEVYTESQIQRILDINKNNPVDKVTYVDNFDYECFSLLPLKIAYEFSYSILEKPYLENKRGVEIRKHLYRAICGEFKGNKKISPLLWGVKSLGGVGNLMNFLKGSSIDVFEARPFHLLEMKSKGRDIYVEVRLFMLDVLSFTVLVARDAADEILAKVPFDPIIVSHNTDFNKVADPYSNPFALQLFLHCLPQKH